MARKVFEQDITVGEHATDDIDEGVVGSVTYANIVKDQILVKLIMPAENVTIGTPYMIEGLKYDFYCMSSNILHENDPALKTIANTFDPLAPMKHGRETSGSLQPVQFPAYMELSCLRMLSKNNELAHAGFKTVPELFSRVRVATDEDISRMVESTRRSPGDTISRIGKFIGTDFDIPVNHSELFRQPMGIFGRTGKGKTISAKAIVISTIANDVFVDDKPVRFIIFDAQGEYARGIGKKKQLGLFQYVPSKVHQLTIDPDTTTKACTNGLFIDPSDLRAEDWANSFWNMNPNMKAVMFEIEKNRKVNLVANGKNETNRDLPKYFDHIFRQGDYDSEKYPSGTMNAIWRRMLPFNSKKFRRSFLKSPSEGLLGVMENIYALLKMGKSIIVHFGRFSQDEDVYMFVTNYVTRRLYNKYSKSISIDNNRLPHLVLMVEEAHRFVNDRDDIGGSSYFSKISRETRKVNLVSAIVDQRPSEIPDDIISQLNSRIIHRLDEIKDLNAALAGLKKKKYMPIVGSLDTGEAIFFGGVVGEVPTLIKPFWSDTSIQAVKSYYGIEDVDITEFNSTVDYNLLDNEDLKDIDEFVGNIPGEKNVSIDDEVVSSKDEKYNTGDDDGLASGKPLIQKRRTIIDMDDPSDEVFEVKDSTTVIDEDEK